MAKKKKCPQGHYCKICGQYKANEKFSGKGHVTSGVTKAVIDGLDVAGSSPFRMLLAENEDTVWVKPDKVCVVEYMPNTQNSLRQPVFKGLRDDVLPEEVRIESGRNASGYGSQPEE